MIVDSARIAVGQILLSVRKWKQSRNVISITTTGFAVMKTDDEFVCILLACRARFILSTAAADDAEHIKRCLLSFSIISTPEQLTFRDSSCLHNA